jgi:hypothetical protein
MIETEVKSLKVQRDRANAELEASKAENAYLRHFVVTMQSTMIEHGLAVPDFQEPEMSQLNAPSESDYGIGMISLHDPTSPIGKPGSQVRFPGLSQPQANAQSEATILHAAATTVSPQLDYFDRSSEPMPFLEDSLNSDSLAWDSFSAAKLNESLHLNNNFPTNASAAAPKFQDHGTPSPVDCAYRIPGSVAVSLYGHINPSISLHPGDPNDLQNQAPSSIFPSTITIDANTQILSPPTALMRTRAAIQLIQMRLRAQHYATLRCSTYTVSPTSLQLAVPHDPRIDLIPCKHMRDRMIVFRGAYDLDNLLQMLLEQAVYHGGNPDDPYNWELPDEFFDEYWFCCVQTDLETTNRWRSERGAPDVKVKPLPFAKLRRLARCAEVGHENIVDQWLQESMNALTLK